MVLNMTSSRFRERLWPLYTRARAKLRELFQASFHTRHLFGFATGNRFDHFPGRLEVFMKGPFPVWRMGSATLRAPAPRKLSGMPPSMMDRHSPRRPVTRSSVTGARWKTTIFSTPEAISGTTSDIHSSDCRTWFLLVPFP